MSPTSLPAGSTPAGEEAGGLGLADRLLLELDVGIAGAAWRAALGALLAGALPGAGLGGAVAALLVVLFLVKSAAAVARRLAPASPVVRTHWEWRRALARWHDSYQWRKLAWFGAGMLAAAWSWDAAPAWAPRLGGACLAAGVVAHVLWRRKGLSLTPPRRR